MQRHTISERPGWREQAESIGFTYHSHETGPYWDESACYELTRAEVDMLEASARTLHELCIEAAGAVIERNWWHRLGIPEPAIPCITRSWEQDEFSLYGRFDVAWHEGTPRLLEYNADTPTALVEASIAQWFWLQDVYPAADQFNSIHERLIEAWRRFGQGKVHLSSIQDNPEDEQTVLYLRDTCLQAGADTASIYIEDLGWHETEKQFVDLEGSPITHCFKLYPWEWLWAEEFAKHLTESKTQFIEPPWKMLLSNKGLLPILWELFPDHPNLLPAYEQTEPLGQNYVRKPRLSREGANVEIIRGGVTVEETGGFYQDEPCIYQALADLPDFGGNRPVLGLWIVDHEPAGLGIREDQHWITGNLSRFVPHFFNP